MAQFVADFEMVWMVVEVVLFLGVVDAVKETAFVFFKKVIEFPAFCGDGAGFVEGGNGAAAGGLFASGEWGEEVEALHGGAFGAGSREEGGGDVVPDGEVARFSLRKGAWQAHDKGDAPGFIVEVVFVVKAVVEELLSVIGCEDDQGVFPEVILVEVVQDAAEEGVAVRGIRIIDFAEFHDGVAVLRVVDAANGFSPVFDGVWVFARMAFVFGFDAEEAFGVCGLVLFFAVRVIEVGQVVAVVVKGEPVSRWTFGWVWRGE